MRIGMTLLAVAAGVVIAGCASTERAGSGGPAADAPTFRVGDRWVYRASDGFRAPLTWEETHEVVSIAPGAITIKVTESGPAARGPRTEVWATPGMMSSGPVFDNETRRFTPPIPIYQFPMSPGQRWGGFFDNVDEATQQAGKVNRTVTVGNWTSVTTPAGTFDALPLRVLTTLDDQTFWRGPTMANYQIHYAPSVGAFVRADKDAHYVSGSGSLAGAVTTQRALLELTSYVRGAP